VSDTTRLWLIRARHQTPSAVVELCRSAGVSAVHCDATPRALHAARELSERLQLSSGPTLGLEPRSAPEPRAEFEARLATALARLAASAPGAQLAVVTGAPIVRTILQLTLGLPPSSANSLRPPHQRACAVDWPASSDPRARPALIGIALDWTPPPAAPQRAKFPGGPGSAPSGRA
jgi:hypothetical protein